MNLFRRSNFLRFQNLTVLVFLSNFIIFEFCRRSMNIFGIKIIGIKITLYRIYMKKYNYITYQWKDVIC